MVYYTVLLYKECHNDKKKVESRN